jgi:hypothetical protein
MVNKSAGTSFSKNFIHFFVEIIQKTLSVAIPFICEFQLTADGAKVKLVVTEYT